MLYYHDGIPFGTRKFYMCALPCNVAKIFSVYPGRWIVIDFGGRNVNVQITLPNQQTLTMKIRRSSPLKPVCLLFRPGEKSVYLRNTLTQYCQ